MRRTFRTYERELLLTFNDRPQMELFIENLYDQLKFVEILMAGVPKRLKIKVRGEKETVKQACRTLKWLQKSILGVTNKDPFGRFRWNSYYFKRLIGGISPDMVLEVLRINGHEIELHEDYFLSTADLNVVQDVAGSIHHIWMNMSYKTRSRALKRVVTIVSVIRNEDPSQIYTEGIEKGVISEQENRLTVNPEHALKTLLGTNPSSNREP